MAAPLRHAAVHSAAPPPPVVARAGGAMAAPLQARPRPFGHALRRLLRRYPVVLRHAANSGRVGGRSGFILGGASATHLDGAAVGPAPRGHALQRDSAASGGDAGTGQPSAHEGEAKGGREGMRCNAHSASSCTGPGLCGAHEGGGKSMSFRPAASCDSLFSALHSALNFAPPLIPLDSLPSSGRAEHRQVSGLPAVLYEAQPCRHDTARPVQFGLPRPAHC